MLGIRFTWIIETCASHRSAHGSGVNGVARSRVSIRRQRCCIGICSMRTISCIILMAMRCSHTRTHAYTRTHTYTRTRTHTHTYTHTHTHTHTHKGLKFGAAKPFQLHFLLHASQVANLINEEIPQISLITHFCTFFCTPPRWPS
jgi:hypothetical protein